MDATRHFLGWDRPGLHAARDWMLHRYGIDADCDMSGVSVVVPGGRAGRRLLELLALEAGRRHLALTPPRIVTVGALPELLYKPDTAVAGPMQSLMARLAALRAARGMELAAVVPTPPAEDDLIGWVLLARDLASLHEQLAAELVTAGDVPDKCAGRLPDFADDERWRCLEQLQRRYEHALRDAGLQDVHAARRAAIDGRRCDAPGEIVLLATADLNQTARRMLEQVDKAVVALVHAPETEADAFDALGCLKVSQWQDRPLDIDDRCVRVVDRPRDQVCELLRVLATDFGDRYAADEITVGLGDQTLGPMVQRWLELAEVSARLSIGRPLAQSRPAMLLDAVAAYAATRRFDTLAALLRHPDAEAFVHRTLASDASRTGVDVWLNLLDRYASEHLHGRNIGAWLGDAELCDQLKAVHDALESLLPPDAAKPRPLSKWRAAVTDVLKRVYGHEPLARYEPEQAQLINALRPIGDALADLDTLAARGAEPPRTSAPDLDPPVTFDAALRVLLSSLSDAVIPPEAGPAAVELLGWLELQLDDAPALVVTGFNEGLIPQSASADAFLPDRLRAALGLVDNARRYARDRMAIEAILRSRASAVFIAGRRGAEDEPLAPSRLLVACGPDDLPARVHRFFNEEHEPAAAPLLLPHGKASRFGIPLPLPREPITRLRVTAFRDYLACPYRFYLKHVLRLQAVDDHAVEMDALLFGGVAHDVLEAFGKSELAASTSPRDIAAFLDEQLDQTVQRKFGAEPAAAVFIQREQLRYRLRAWAQWQATQVIGGWHTLHVERDFEASLDVDGEAFFITGRIDRIDRHGDGRHRLLDYKTSESGDKPEKTHQSGGQWCDLQLPLYRLLARSVDVGDPVELGYVVLPKNVQEVGERIAGWTLAELDAAVETARHVVRCLREGVFWPPTFPPHYEDEFASICMDKAMERADAVRRAERELAQPPRGGAR